MAVNDSMRRHSRYAHGHATAGKPSPEYVSWACMIQRCTNPNTKTYHRYGGRGITVCERWLSFENFLADMGTRPAPGHSIERIDNDGNYEPGNCRWATRSDQMKHTSRTRLITAFGKTQTFSDWCKELSISKGTLHKRLAKGLSAEHALSGR